MLRAKRKEIIQYVRSHKEYLGHNFEIYDIYRGNLLPYVVKVLQDTLSQNYFDKIKERIVPINVLERYVKKVASAYENPPKRTANSDSGQEVVDYYVKQFNLNKKGQIADQYSHLFKGYAWEPFMDQRQAKLRVLPFDRFLVYSDDDVDPTRETVFIKMMGKKNVNNKMVEIFYTFTADEIDAFDEHGVTYEPALEGNEGINLYETIPFVYGNRAENELLPIQDTDIKSMSKLISIFLSDMSGAIMFQCFSIIYGIDLDMENAKMSPNALWSFKSDATTDKNPQIGTIKPEADIEKVMSFVISTFVLWLETKGIRVGSIGSMDAGNTASGISKIIDEMDVYKIVKDSVQFFQADEQELWKKMIKIHNFWLASGQVKNLPILPEDFQVEVTFPEPQPKRSRKDIIEEKDLEVKAGFKSRRKAIMELNPESSAEDLELELAEMGGDESEEFGYDPLIANDSDVRKETLNGAQIESLVNVVVQFKLGNIDRDSAKQIIMSSFGISDKEADIMVGDKNKVVSPDSGQTGAVF